MNTSHSFLSRHLRWTSVFVTAALLGSLLASTLGPPPPARAAAGPSTAITGAPGELVERASHEPDSKPFPEPAYVAGGVGGPRKARLYGYSAGTAGPPSSPLSPLAALSNAQGAARPSGGLPRAAGPEGAAGPGAGPGAEPRFNLVAGDENWSALGSGANAQLNEVVVDATGIVYAGGFFTTTGGVAANYVAKWDPATSTWSALGSGMNGDVRALAFDATGALYAGGLFTTAGGGAASGVAKWDGSAWSALGSGMNSDVYDLTTSGGNLYAGGNFTSAGGVAANYIAKWDGSAWSALGSGANAAVVSVRRDASGNVYAGGHFTLAGGVANTSRIAKWDGANWSALGSGMNGSVRRLELDASGNLYAVGWFTLAGGVANTAYVAKWNGTSWSALGSGMNNAVWNLALDGTGNLYAGGAFTSAGGVAASRIAKWNGSTWSALGSGMNNEVFDLAVDASGKLYAGGMFTTAGGGAANYIASWRASSTTALSSSPNPSSFGQSVTFTATVTSTLGGGRPTGNLTFKDGATALATAALASGNENWSALGSGMNATVRALAYYGGNLYAGGVFGSAGGVANTAYIAKWDGASWSALGSGMNAVVTALAFDSSGNLYAGGAFTTAGGVAANRIAKWNGATWSALGSGIDNEVWALTFDASGNLYAGGYFSSAGGVANTSRIAKWNGSAWSALGTGMNNWVDALAFSGGNLYAGGTFSSAGGVAASYVAKWNGSAWSALGSGLNADVYALATSGGQLYAGGGFTTDGGGAANYIAKWNGSAWSALGSGMNAVVTALAFDGSGQLYAGGDLTSAGGVSASRMARWDGSAWSALGSGVSARVSSLAFDGSGQLYAGGDLTSAGGVSASRVAAWRLAGTATLSSSALSAGAHSITAEYAGDSNFSVSTSSALSQTVNKASSTTSLASSPNPSSFGQSVTFTATVTSTVSTPTGNVTFKDGASTLATAALSSGTATYSTAALSVGAHSITAEYAGDSSFNASASSALSQTVNKASSSTALSSSPNPSTFGQSVTFTATVTATAGTPTGNVAFKEGATTLATVALSSGTATFSTSTLALGAHSITAQYGGDSSFNASASAALSQVVGVAATATSLSSSPNPSTFGQSVTLNATVLSAGGTPTGSVTFKEGDTILATAALSGGGASFSTAALSVGSHSITAQYGGDSNFNASASSALSQGVGVAATATSLSSSPNPSTFGQTVTLNATVLSAGGTPTGSVTFKEGATVLNTVALSGGTATFSTSALSVGTHSITAEYGGDSSFNASVSSALSQGVGVAATATSLSSSPNPSTFSQSVTFTATVASTAGTPTGNVAFKEGATALGTAALSGGRASFSTSALSAGSHSITAQYAGDSNFNASASSALSQTVNKADSSTALSASPNPSTFGQTVYFTATVASTAGTPTGNVTFMEGASTLGTAALSAGRALFSTASLSVGAHSLTAQYAGEGSFNSSASSALSQAVNRAPAPVGGEWSEGFGLPGANGDVQALVSDGRGNLYAGGHFTTIGGTAASGVAKWNGATWSALGTGIDAEVLALAVDSSGNLYAGGWFYSVGGVANTAYIARWNGTSWSALGSGVNGGVYALAVDGQDNLYAGGSFSSAGGGAANYIARWNGATWSALGSGVNGSVAALATAGGNLYAGGWFTSAGRVTVNRIAKWDGKEWRALGAGMNNGVRALALDASGQLYAGGDFWTAVGVANTTYIAKWNGATWSPLGSGMNGGVHALATSGGNLYAGGYFNRAGGVATTQIARWNGSTWSALGSGINGDVQALALDPSGNLYAGGSFSSAGGVANTTNMARWDSTRWSALAPASGRFNGISGEVYALAVDGKGNLYAGGDFYSAGGVAASRIAKWDGTSWSALEDGLDGEVRALAFDDKGNLYAGGYFEEGVEGPDAENIARWDGSRWWALGKGIDGEVRALAFSGGNLYAGGDFEEAGDVDANNVAKWDGKQWSPLGSGTLGEDTVYALAVDGQGNLYAGGDFEEAGGVENTSYIAKWDPLSSTWSPLGSGIDDYVKALAVDGWGRLYVGGEFESAGGVANTAYIARWDGANWSALGSGMDDDVYALAVDGSGNLYAGGDFTTAGGKASNYIGLYTMPPTPASTAATLSSSPNPSVSGQSVTFTATITSTVGTPTGSVAFKEGATTLGTASLSGGRAVFSTSGLSAGSHAITAQYAGDVSFEPSASPFLDQVVMVSAAAAPWPEVWNPYTYLDGSPIRDPDRDVSPAYADVSSGAEKGVGSLPSLYTASDGSNVFFRFRLHGDPSKPTHGGFESTAYMVAMAVNGVQVATVGLDGKSPRTDYVYVANADGSAVDPVYATPFAGAAAGARALSDGSGFYFLDFQVPISRITARAPTVKADTPVQLFFGTSQAANLSVINKDYVPGDSVDFSKMAVTRLQGVYLTLTKGFSLVSGPHPPEVGRTTTYDLALTAANVGSGALRNLAITDTIPAGVTLLSASTLSGTIGVSGQTGTVNWTLGSLSPGARATATIRVSVTPAASQAGQSIGLNSGASGSGAHAVSGQVYTAASNAVQVGPVANPVGTMAGTVADQGGSALVGVTVRIYDSQKNLAATATTGAGGAYSAPNLPAGSYRVAFSRSGYREVSASAGVERGATTTVNASLSPLAGSLAGTVASSATSRAALGATVELLDSAGSVMASTASSDTGQYSFSNVPTEVSLAVRASHPDYAATASSLPVRLGAGGSATAHLKLLPLPGGLAGRVTDRSNGLALPGALVALYDANRNLAATALADGEGSYSLSAVGEGTYTVEASRGTAYRRAAAQAVVLPNRTTPLDLALSTQDGTLYGRVSEAGGETPGAPIVGATVSLLDSNGGTLASASTDSLGEYYFLDLAEGAYTVAASAAWHSMGREGKGKGGSKQVYMPAGDSLYQGLSLLGNLGSMAGRVVDSRTGASLEGVKARLYDSYDNQAGYATSDGAGIFAFEGVPVGSYQVFLSKPDYLDDSISAQVLYGRTSQVSGVLSLKPGSIWGTVKSASTTRSLVGADVSLKDASGGVLDTVQSDASGRYAFPQTAPGSYVMAAGHPDYQTGSRGSAQVALSPGGSTAQDLFLSPRPSAVSGRVTSAATGQAVPGARLWVYDQGQNLVATAALDATGAYTVTGVIEGTYTFMADGSAAGYLPATAVVEVGPDRVQTQDLALTPRAGSLSGLLTDAATGEPIPGATVVLTYTNGATASARTNAGGEYAFTAVAAEAPITLTAEATPPFYLQGAGSTTGATVPAGGSATANLRLHPGPGSISGLVADNLTGAPLAGVTVQVYDANDNRVGQGVTDSQGGLSLEQVPAGTYSLRADKANYHPGSVTKRVKGGASLQVKILLAPVPGSIVGKVLDSASLAAMAGAKVSLVDANGQVQDTTLSQATGAYAFSGVVPGSYTVAASHGDYDTGSQGSAALVLSPGGQAERDLRLDPKPSAITGRAASATTGQAVASARVMAYDANGNLAATVATDASGLYTVTNLAQGAHTLSVDGSAAGYLLSTVSVALKPAQSLVQNLALAPRAGSFSGTLTNAASGEPIAGAQVKLAYPDGSMAYGRTSAAGEYAFTEVTAQVAVTVTALEARPYYLQTADSTATGTVPAGGASTANLRLQPGPGSVTGVATSSLGPVSGATLQLYDAKGNLVAQVTTGADGTYTLSGLPPGTYTLSFSKAGWLVSSYSAKVEPGATSSLDLAPVPLAGSIAGTVKTSSTLRPLARAAIILADSAGSTLATTLSDATGKYAFAGVTPGTYRVTAQHPDYQTGSKGTATGVLYTEGSLSLNLTLDPRPATITGRVASSSTGQPIPGATLRVYRANGDLLATVTANASGVYTLANIPESSEPYILEWTAPSYLPATNRLAISSGQRAVQNTALAPVEGSLSGKVTDAITGKAIQRATVEVRGSSGDILATSRTDRSGRYLVVGLPSQASLTVSATAPNYRTIASSSATVPFVLSSSVSPAQRRAAALSGTAELQLQPNPGSVSGKATDSTTGAPLPGATVQLYDANNNLVATATTDAGGAYTFPEVTVGDYTIAVTGRGFLAGSQAISVDPGQAGARDVPLPPQAGSVSGAVTEATTGKPLSGATVVLTDTAGQAQSTTSQANGAFAFAGVSAGTSVVGASHPDYTTGNGSSSNVILLPGQAARTDLALYPRPGQVSGTVLDPTTKQPVAGGTIQVRDSSGNLLGTFTTDAQGRYYVRNLPPGSYTISFSRAGYLDASSTLRVSPNQAVEASIVAVPVALSISGAVTNSSTGQAIAGARVELLDGSGGLVSAALTGGAGRYVFAAVSQGTYTLRASHVECDSGAGASASLTLAAGQAATRDLRMDPKKGAIQVTVLDQATGQPLAGASITISNTQGLVATLTTDSQGQASKDGLPAGAYQVTASRSGLAARAATATVEPNRKALASLRLGYLIRATVLETETNQPVVGATVLLAGAGGAQAGAGATRAGGALLLDVTATGTYTISTSAPEFDQVGQSTASLSLSAGSPSVSATLYLARQKTPHLTLAMVRFAPRVLPFEVRGLAAGEPIYYGISYGNYGTTRATGVVITETLPLSTTFLGPAGWTRVDARTYTYNVGILGVGERGAVQFVVAREPALAPASAITNTVTIGDDGRNGRDLRPASAVTDVFRLHAIFLPLLSRAWAAGW